jgi:hypothetical protein
LALVGDWWHHLKTVWWHGLQAGDRGTWVGGIATAVAVIVTLIIAGVTAIQQGRQNLKLRKETQAAARRSHAEKFSCWVSGRINSPAKGLSVGPGDLVVALMNASQQPFMEAVVEVELLKEADGSVSIRRFKISAVPPGVSWFAFHSDGKPERHLLSIWYLDNGMRLWNRSSSGELTEIKDKDKDEVRSDKGEGADHASLHHGEPAATLGLDDAWA